MICHRTDDVPDQQRLAQTAGLLAHRGPDGHGMFAEPGVGLVHTRLSLLDLSERSNQPFWDKEKRLALVYNGEIYNFAELRAELEEAGVEFRTMSDTEVLMEALVKWGPDATLPRLEGMFAFGLYDTVSKSLLLARDRFGIKPLFVYDTPEMFVFSSEIRAMRPWVTFEPDLLSISGFLYGFSGPTKGFSFFKHIRIIEPGGVVNVKKGGSVQRSRFFSLVDFVDRGEMERLAQLRPQDLVDRVDELLNQSVKAQLVADAPVGALCSGGLDSSVIMAIAAKYHTNLAIFHANVVGPVSEYPAAVRLAKHLKLDLKAAEVHDHDFIDSIPEVTEHFGHPFYSCPHSVPYLAVSRLVRRSGVKAVLSGEASDEYFLGYSYCSPDIRRYVGVGSMLRTAKRWLRPPPPPNPMRYRGPLYVQGGDAWTMEGLVHALHNRFETVNETIEIRDRIGHDSDSSRFRGVLPSLDLLGYNLRALLHRNDSMGMAASIEARFPFLENRLAKLAVNMPYDSKIRFALGARDDSHYFFRDKWVMRKVAERYVPRELVRQNKKPFPINAYAEERMRIAPAYFDRSFISELFELGRNENAHFLERCPHWLKWKMVLLDVWAHVSLNGTCREAMLGKLRQHISLTNPEYSGFLR
jgi:asparagine synthase (glutamine-hydrolysing)